MTGAQLHFISRECRQGGPLHLDCAGSWAGLGIIALCECGCHSSRSADSPDPLSTENSGEENTAGQQYLGVGDDVPR